MKKISCILLLLFQLSANAQINQSVSLQDYLVKRIAQQQVIDDDFFLAGIYPSYITNKQQYAERQKDLTIFYNALIDETLQHLRSSLSAGNRRVVDHLYQNSLVLYPRFKNKHGRNTYNFWVRDSNYTFPYSRWIPLIKRDPHVPDDMDDTSISHLALNSPADTAASVHRLFQQFTNKKDKKLNTISRKYRKEAAYSTWFGKKFPVVFDVSVLANTLYFVQKNQLRWTAADSASLSVILEAIDSRDYIIRPMLISPYYGKASIILYHVSRLMSVKDIPELEARKTALATAARGLFLTSQSSMEKIILSSALKRWGFNTGWDLVVKEAFAADSNYIKKEVEESNLPFFIGNIPSYFPYGIKKLFTRLDALVYYHYCPAYNNVLLLEYLMM